MLDAPVDAWYLWLGLAVASIALAGVATTLPTAPPPDATRVADAVDAAAASDHPVTAEVPLSAAAIRLSPHRVALRGPGGTAHAALAYGPVVPVAEGSRLWRVLQGAPPGSEFDTGAALRRAVDADGGRTETWRRRPGRLLVRTLAWEGVDVTLVGA